MGEINDLATDTDTHTDTNFCWEAMNIKPVLAHVLITVAVFLVISSFATLTEGEGGSSLF
jgi:hypothetical protein